MARRTKPRRGVLLLIVLSLLVLFLLMGMSFLVSATQFNKLAGSSARTDLQGMPGDKLANSVLYQLVRGTTNPYSAIRGHSLLEDLYGRDYLVGEATAVADYEGSRGQMLEVRFTASRLGGALPEDTVAQELKDDYYAGCVLTFLNGSAKGSSTRVLRYKPSVNTLVVSGTNLEGGTIPLADTGQTTIRFLINGRPFNGTGAGYNRLSGNLGSGSGQPNEYLDSTYSTAFFPNHKTYAEIGAQDDTYNYGGLDESWDAADYQNMFLARRGNVPNDMKLPIATAADPYQRVIPSFHRPFLYSYLQNILPATDFADLQRGFMFRPVGPAFTGSNPNFDPINGPWDVDNDGDGEPDSIWMDAGLAPVSGPDGRLYKPLVAIHVLDMDGRLNINAIDGLERAKYSATTGGNSTRLNTPEGYVLLSGLANPQAKGAGFGPADISGVNPLMTRNWSRQKYTGNRKSNSAFPTEEVTNTAGTNNQLPWVEEALPGIGPYPAAELTTVPGGTAPSNTVTNDTSPYDLNPSLQPPAYFGFSSNFHPVFAGSGITPAVSLNTGFGTVADYHARSIPFLDANGQLVYGGVRLGMFDAMDDPYEINLNQPESHDSPFDVTELEQICRPDIVQSDNRLGAVGALMRNNITTHSFSIPAPPSINSGRFRGTQASGDGLKRSLRELYAARIRRVSGISEALAFERAATLMPEEFERGEKLDINRVLVSSTLGMTPAQRVALALEKQRFARHLYNLMLLLSDDVALQTPNATTPADINLRRDLHRRRIAQWAVNVVDFGDADSVMTRLDYDFDPFDADEAFTPNGAPVPGAPSLRTVWGMEHPELLLTETLAFHDRRASDSTEEDGGALLGPEDDDDDDLDSVVEPEGSLFIELMCVRAQDPPTGGTLWNVAPRGPEDLYADTDGQPATPNLLQLGRHLPESTKPVWRLGISDVQDGAVRSPLEAISAVNGQNPDVPTFEPQQTNPLVRNPNDLNLQLDRYIWFSNRQPPAGGGEETQANTYRDKRMQQPVVAPGSYVLIGPRAVTSVGTEMEEETSTDPDTGETTSTFQPSPQEIRLDGIHQRVDNSPLRPTPPQRLVGFIAEAGGAGATDRGVNVSEPLDGYAGSALPSDIPLDAEASAVLDELDTKTTLNYRTVFLQRLADPNLPWNEVTNPYRTVDWMPVDLTVFNSLYDGVGDPDDAEEGNVTHSEFLFASREKSGVPRFENPPNLPVRNQHLQSLINNGMFNIWSAWTQLAPRITTLPPGLPPGRVIDGPRGEAIAAGAGGASSLRSKITDAVNTNVPHTLGWLNRAFDFVAYDPPAEPGVTLQSDRMINPVDFDGLDHYRTLGPYQEAPGQIFAPRDIYGIPTTFSTLEWHNRPYANPYELMLVPATSSARRSVEYSVAGAVDTTLPKFAETAPRDQQPNPQPFSPITPWNGTPAAQVAAYRGGFGHLLNFFNSSNGVKGETSIAPNFHRVFDFVTVPSLFKGTRKWLNDPGSFSSNNVYRVNTSNYVDVATSVTSISEFREPGKVNINTAPYGIWNNVGFSSFAHPDGNSMPTSIYATLPDGTWFNRNPSQEFRMSMEGVNPLITDPMALPASGANPAMYPNPLRAGVAADLVLGDVTRPAVDATMLRSAYPIAGAGVPVTGRQPVLGSVPAEVSQFQNSRNVDILQNRKTSAYFRYKDLIKMGNSVTTQSNVYAIWITIGYFEVEPNYPNSGGTDDLTRPYFVDNAHPDGYRFGIEMGSDTGQVTRHRSFYIVDRSIPVAFEPGVNHNVDKAILLRRRLE